MDIFRESSVAIALRAGGFRYPMPIEFEDESFKNGIR
jgi:hypothetical protein